MFAEVHHRSLFHHGSQGMRKVLVAGEPVLLSLSRTQGLGCVTVSSPCEFTIRGVWFSNSLILKFIVIRQWRDRAVVIHA